MPMHPLRRYAVLVPSFALAIACGSSTGNTSPPEATTTVLTSSANPSVAGNPVTFTATVTAASGTVTGTVVFKENGSNIPTCTAQRLSSGETTCTLANLTVGTHAINAVFSGNSRFDISNSAAVNQVVNP